MTNLEYKAKVFATRAHASIGQLRKYTGEPYIVHPAEVVEIVRSRPHTPEMLAAAWLHDVVEDTGVPIEEIFTLFGTKVGLLVAGLTDVSQRHQGNREVRKAIDRAHTAAASPEAKTIKLADLISNTRSIAKHDPDFARTYLKEKALLLEVLKEGDRELWKLANQILEENW